MKQGLKALWIGALRSGLYKQGKGTLRKDDKYCCLGVLVDIMDEEWTRNESGEWGLPYDEDQPGVDLQDGSLPSRTLAAINLHDDQQQELIKLNDGQAMINARPGAPISPYDPLYIEGFEPKSFDYIADYISENF